MSILFLFCKHGKQQNQIVHDNNCKQEKIKHQMKCFSWPDCIKDINPDCLSMISISWERVEELLFVFFH